MDPVRLAAELIRARSPSTEEGPARAVLEAALRELGLDLEVDRAGNLYALKEGRGPEVALTGHMDTVPAGDEGAWPVPPFAGEVRDGFVWGRGAVDMKGALAAMVAAAAELVQARYPGRFSLLFVGAEEVGGAGSRHAAGWVRPAVFVLGEPSRRRLVRGHRGRIEPHLVFTGRQGHAALENPENPLFALGEALVGLRGLELGADPDTGPNTCQPTQVRVSPNAINVVPGRVELTLDCRYGPRVGSEGVLRAVGAAAAGGRLEVPELEVRLGEAVLTYPFDFPPYVLPPGDPWLQRALGVLGQKEAPLWPFTTDAPYLARTGAPVLGFGPGDPALAHTTEERVEVGELLAAARDYVRLVRALGEEA
ncbi:MAG TPA: M20 family peptidase [Oceanithermus sp.]|nr:M20 family peptidase [Oceanithermus sp.]